jgi:hypothetical protein
MCFPPKNDHSGCAKPRKSTRIGFENDFQKSTFLIFKVICPFPEIELPFSKRNMQ